MSDDMQEKFVADDGVSTVPSPVTPQGGEPKKKLADVKKAVDPKAEKVAKASVSEAEEADEAEVIEEEVISIDESIASMFEGMDLSLPGADNLKILFQPHSPTSILLFLFLLIKPIYLKFDRMKRQILRIFFENQD